jgi:hypothetical protein
MSTMNFWTAGGRFDQPTMQKIQDAIRWALDL